LGDTFNGFGEGESPFTIPAANTAINPIEITLNIFNTMLELITNCIFFHYHISILANYHICYITLF
jgi:hypothetical protein